MFFGMSALSLYGGSVTVVSVTENLPRRAVMPD